MKSTYHCIGGCMGNPRHHVEHTSASYMMWIVPGTYPEDPATDAAGAMAHAATDSTNQFIKGGLTMLRQPDSINSQGEFI